MAADFPAYDADQSSQLDQAEFSQWVRALRVASPGSPPTSEADLQVWAAASFTQADGDRSGSVDQAETVAFLSGSGT